VVQLHYCDLVFTAFGFNISYHQQGTAEQQPPLHVPNTRSKDESGIEPIQLEEDQLHD
jgi:hypothetical protein